MTSWHTKARYFLPAMWMLALEHGGSITGGCRDYARNRRVGGHPKSKHLLQLGGLAVDFVFVAEVDRDAAADATDVLGYFPYIGPDYGPFRLHVQAIAPGADPLSSLNDIPN